MYLYFKNKYKKIIYLKKDNEKIFFVKLTN